MTDLDDRYERMKDKYPEPLCWLLGDLFEKNKEYYVENSIRTDTVGAEYIREDGFTRNQLRWADEIKDQIEQGDGAGDWGVRCDD